MFNVIEAGDRGQGHLGHRVGCGGGVQGCRAGGACHSGKVRGDMQTTRRILMLIGAR